MVLLDHDDDSFLSIRGNLTVKGAYQIILFIFCVGIVGVLPFSVGAHTFERISSGALRRMMQVPDADDRKYSKQLWQSPWWLRLGLRVMWVLLKLCHRFMMAPLLRLVKRQIQKFLPSEPVLIMTVDSQEGNGSRHGPKTPTSGNGGNNGNNNLSKNVVMGGLCGIVSTLILLKALGPLVIYFPTQTSPQILSTVISWLCAVGLLISSTLNGFGCVSLPHSCLSGLFLEPIRPEVLARAEMELRSTTKSYEAKLTELHSDSGLSLDYSEPARQRKTVSHTSGKIAFADFNSDESTKRKRDLQNEIDFLDTLMAELKEDIAEMKYAQEQAASARSTMGKIRSYIGILFSVVLLIRLYTATLSILQGYYMGPEPARGDPITTALLWLTGHNFVSDKDYNTLSQGISLLLTAVLSATQVRTFLRVVSALNRRILLIYRKCYCAPRRQQTGDALIDNDSYVKIHTRVLAAFTGCYFLSCVVLTKMNLPYEYRSSFSAALGGMEYSIRTPVVNLVFCTSAGVSAMILGLLFGIQRQNTKRHASDESLGADLVV
jgi:hypothetical protein